MALFNPEGLFRSLVSAMGLTPEQIQGFVTELTNELRDMRADRLAFKPASIRVVAEVRADLARIEAKLDRLLTLSGATSNERNVIEYRNGSGGGDGQPGGSHGSGAAIARDGGAG